AGTPAPCTRGPSRSTAGSFKAYLRMIDSKLHRPSMRPSSTPPTSYGIAASRSATAVTSGAGTYRNSASGSMKRLMSHGHAIRSTLAFFLVTHFIDVPPCYLALGNACAVALFSADG